MSLYMHTDIRTRRPLTRSGAIGCTHATCSRYASTSSRPGVEIVVNTRTRFGNAITVMTPCMQHRRSMLQQRGRGISEYANLVFTGIAPTPDIDYDSAAIAVSDRQAEVAAEREAERRRIIEQERPQIWAQYLESTSLMSGPTVTPAERDDYGRRYIRLPYISGQLTPGQAETLANALMQTARTLRAELEEPPF